MEQKIKQEVDWKKVEVHWCLNGKRDKNKYTEAERGSDDFRNVPPDLIRSWAKTGCSACAGSGLLKITIDEKKNADFCSCAKKRFAKAHKDS